MRRQFALMNSTEESLERGTKGGENNCNRNKTISEHLQGQQRRLWRSLLHQYIGSWVRYEQNGGKKNKTITNVKVNIIFTAQTVRNDWVIPVEIKVAETDSEISDKDPNIQIVT